MLLLDRQKISPLDLMSKFATKEDYDAIVKKSSFEINKSRVKKDPFNNGRSKSPKATSFRTSFFVTDKRTGLKVEIRYAESHNPKVVGNSVIDTYEPRYIQMTGVAYNYQNNLDLAVFLFLRPSNELSPFRSNTSTTPSKYEFIDTKKRAKIKMSAMDSLSKAMSHARELPADELVILAKGLGLKSVDGKDTDEVRADLMEYASKFHIQYNEKIGTQITFLEGKIANLIDRGVVKLTPVGQIRRWAWAKGDRTGEHIVDVQSNVQNPRIILKNHFFSDLGRYMSILDEVTHELTANERAEKALKSMSDSSANEYLQQENPVIGDNLPNHLKDVNQMANLEDIAPSKYVYTENDAIRALSEGKPDNWKPHFKSIEKWIREKNAE